MKNRSHRYDMIELWLPMHEIWNVSQYDNGYVQ